MEDKNDGVMIYREYYPAFMRLCDGQLGQLVRAMLEYGMNGTPQDFSGDKLLQLVWAFIFVDIDQDMGR